MDWSAEGLLDGLEGDAREARGRLLDALYRDGVPLEELRAAVAEDRLVLIPIERALLGPAQYTLAEIAERGGLPLEATRRRLRTMGITVPEDPDTRAFGDDEVEVVRRGRRYLERGMGFEEGGPVVHLMSGSMARVAEAIRTLFAQTYLRAGDREDDLGLRYGEMAAELTPLVAEDLDYLVRMHLRDFARSDALSIDERAAGRLSESFDVAVAFVDIVGFTALGEELPETELPAIAGRLEDLAGEHIRQPARVVKTIGDAVMVVSRDAAALVEGITSLMDAAGGDPSLRAGIAYGRAVPRLGDWYGPAVNLAARVAQRARPEAVLVAPGVVEVLGDAELERFALSPAGLKRLRGIDEPVPLWRARLSARAA
jgi:adenylate cyclase